MELGGPAIVVRRRPSAWWLVGAPSTVRPLDAVGVGQGPYLASGRPGCGWLLPLPLGFGLGGCLLLLATGTA